MTGRGNHPRSSGARPAPVDIEPQLPFNIIYSSGTTGTPKGIVQPHGMRWTHVQRGAAYGYGPESVTLLATPLYSNTTLVVLFPTLACGGAVHLMAKFDAAEYLKLASDLRVTHTMLVPVQYQRIMARPDFDRHDLRSFHMKFCTSAPFGAALKADILKRWPGGLIEFYGMTEGGGTCILEAHHHPDKLHTVGQVAPGSDIRLIDEAGREVKPGHLGIIYRAFNGRLVGRSSARTLVLARDGRVVSGRTLSKIRNGERGAAAGYETLLQMGAPRRMPGEADAAWVSRALRDGPFRRLPHPGNLAYVWGLDEDARAALPPTQDWKASA